MGRGPSYPYVDLEQAVVLTKQVWEFTKRSPALQDSVIKEAWGLSPTSSSSQKILAALRSYGLLEDGSNNGQAKSVKVTDRSIRIILDEPESPARLQALKDAALSPKWYQFCWDQWGSDMPPSVRSKLLIEHHFVESTVDGFLEDYRKTLAYARLTGKPQAPQLDTNSAANSAQTSPPTFKVGDYVQWESQGQLKLPKAKKLAGFSEDGQWAFVDGSSTGIPVAQLIAENAPEDAPLVPPPAKEKPPMPKGESGMRQEVCILGAGDATIQIPANLSSDDLEDLSYWLDGLKLKLSRIVKKAEAERSSG